MAMNTTMFGDPITPVVNGVKTLAAKWPIITSMAIVNYGNDLVMDMAPTRDSLLNRLIGAGMEGATQIVLFATWDAAKGAH